MRKETNSLFDPDGKHSGGAKKIQGPTPPSQNQKVSPRRDGHRLKKADADETGRIY